MIRVKFRYIFLGAAHQISKLIILFKLKSILDFIVLGKDNSDCVLLVNATMCLNLSKEPYYIYIYIYILEQIEEPNV